MPQPNWLVQLGFAKESVWGTPVTPPTFSVSVDAPVFDEQQDPIPDRGLRGVRSATQSMSFGAGHSEVNVPEMPWYGDDSGHWLMAMLGVDTVTGTARTGTISTAAQGATSLTYAVVTGTAPLVGDPIRIDGGLATAEIVVPTIVTGAGPYTLTVPATKFAHTSFASNAFILFTHTITMLNTGAPPSYTGVKFDNLVATARQIAGIYFEQVDLKLASPGKFTVSAKGRGKMGVNVAKPTYPAYSAEPFNVPWQAVFTVAGLANARFVGFDASIKAPNDQIFGMAGTQSPTSAVSDQVTVDGKALIVPDDYTEFNYYINNTQPPVSFVLDNGNTRTTIQMSRTGFMKPAILDHKGNYTLLSAAFEAIANATDAGVGNAAIKAILLNTRATAY